MNSRRVQEAGRDSVGQLVGPGIAAEIVEPGVAEAGVGIVIQQIDAGKTAFRELIPAGDGHAVLSGAKLVKVNHLALAYPGWGEVRPASLFSRTSESLTSYQEIF
jgi:hypothetical protein